MGLVIIATVAGICLASWLVYNQTKLPPDPEGHDRAEDVANAYRFNLPTKGDTP